MNRSFKSNSGYSILAVGLGTWQLGPNEVKEAATEALKIGYRHIDAAAVYGNEAEIGQGIKASGVDREDIFITGKLWNTDHKPEDADYLDLYLIHWPVAFSSLLRDFRGIQSPSRFRIGVSNFTREKLASLLSTARILLAVNQIEAHAYLQQPELLEWSKRQNIVVAAYSPLGNNIYNLPRAVDDRTVIKLAHDLNKPPAQLLISWAVQRGTVVLPKNFEPPQEVFDQITALDRHHRHNFPARLGVNIFGEVSEESLKKSVDDWKAAQRKLNAT
ncbi:aldehyde reductase-like protein [Hyaloscypha hepaticicola]|uniref:Aldehyde reductase-like protein n=1 Tax=Hyaloscypha hepaticicola TaxID=2082293 RepID=A0A2J6PQ00_9HELO|nr:aldehyde reductase-like protein [Hyaloscypha hepaticicola]